MSFVSGEKESKSGSLFAYLFFYFINYYSSCWGLDVEFGLGLTLGLQFGLSLRLGLGVG